MVTVWSVAENSNVDVGRIYWSVHKCATHLPSALKARRPRRQSRCSESVHESVHRQERFCSTRQGLVRSPRFSSSVIPSKSAWLSSRGSGSAAESLDADRMSAITWRGPSLSRDRARPVVSSRGRSPTPYLRTSRARRRSVHNLRGRRSLCNKNFVSPP